MYQKLKTQDQLEMLKEGDLLYKFPSTGVPETNFAEQRHADIDTYTIRAINRNEGIVKLVTTDGSTQMFTWPGDVERLNIRRSLLITEGIWWTN